MTKGTRELDIILGNKISKYRTSKNISRKELADAIGITHQQIHKYEKGINRISVSRLYEICDYLSVNPKILLDIGDEDKNTFSGNENSNVLNEIMVYISSIEDKDKLKAIKNLAKAMGGN